MTLILFDIDGTLTATSQADNGCYERAFFRAFNVPLPTTDWHAYKHVTDLGVVQEVIEPARGCAASTDEIKDFESAYADELQRAYDVNPTGFSEVPGARVVLDTIKKTDSLSAALSTGGMRRTALFKLRQAGIDGTKLPGAFANDAISRADIARLAIERSGIQTDDIVYVGDGLWDLRTSAELGLRFIGITRESSAERLRANGANVLLDDYADSDAFFAAVRDARVPRVP